MGFWEEVRESLAGLWKWITSEETQENLLDLINFVAKVAGAVALLNDVPTNERKNQISRDVMRFLIYAPEEVLLEALELKKSGRLESLAYQDHELDLVHGAGVAKYIKEMKTPKSQGGLVDDCEFDY